MSSYRDLIVWQKSINLVKLVYDNTKTFPKEEQYGITSQIRRSAVSIPSNNAEGFGRFQTNDYVRFLQIARGSLFELQTQIEISKLLEYITESDFKIISELTIEIEKMINSMINKTSSKNITAGCNL